MQMSTELTTIDNPKLRWSVGGDVANVCREIVLATSVLIPKTKKKHVCVEGWQSIAAAWGCTPGVVLLEHEEGGVRAKAVLKRDSDGAILSEAYGFCGKEESFANGVLRFPDRHAVEGMAQTRAISRVCANKFRFVVVLIDKDLSATPAEEMPVAPLAAAAEPVPTSEQQTIEGKLTKVFTKDGWTYGEIKGLQLSTKRQDVGKAMELLKDANVSAVVKKLTTAEGKVRWRPQSFDVLDDFLEQQGEQDMRAQGEAAKMGEEPNE